MIQRGSYGAYLQKGGVDVGMPDNFDSLFTSEELYGMSFTTAGVAMECHFFTPEEIELSFDPEDVTEESLQGLLAFMIELGNATNKAVIMTPENYRESPIFRYAPNEPQLRWLAPPK